MIRIGITYRKGVSFEWTSEGAQLVKYTAKHPGVRFVVVFLPHADLRGKIVRRPQ